MTDGQTSRQSPLSLDNSGSKIIIPETIQKADKAQVLRVLEEELMPMVLAVFNNPPIPKATIHQRLGLAVHKLFELLLNPVSNAKMRVSDSDDPALELVQIETVLALRFEYLRPKK